MRTKLNSIAGACCLALIAGLAGCKPAGNAGDQTGPMLVDDHGLLSVPANSPLRSHLAVEALSGAAAGGWLEAPAAVEADPARTANILAPLTGRVVALKVSLGQAVRRGQVLAVLASGDFAQASTDVDKAQDAYDTASKALDRAKGVRAAGGAADKDLEAAQSAYDQAEAELVRARTRLASLGAGPGARNLTLTAPQDGVITTLAIAQGAQVSDPTATLMTVTNIGRVYVTANVAEGDVGQVRAGQEVDVTFAAYPGQTWHGRVASVDALLQPDTRRRKVRVAFDNADGRLLPNMYGTASIAVAAPAGQAAAVWAPQSALVMNNDVISVFVEVRPWVFQRQPVKIGDETADSAQIVSGLTPGERVVVRGGVLLND